MKVVNQSVFDTWQIEDKSVQAVITSPPYYALRKYDIPDVVIGNWQGQYGLEPDYKLYVEHTRLWAKEAWRVLRDDGVFFLNLADSYGSGFSTRYNKYKSMAGNELSFAPKLTIHKCQLLIPHRVAMVLVDDGWVLRNTIIWYKPNAMPESVTDRFSKKYEYVFMFVKNQRYCFDLDAVREEHKPVSKERAKRGCSGHHKYSEGDSLTSVMGINKEREEKGGLHPNGKNPGDVWSINTQASSEKHFAMWPEKLVERMVLCSTKAGDIVLDPFAGSGTTLRVADRLNRIGQGIDLGYQEIQSRRLKEIQKELVW